MTGAYEVRRSNAERNVLKNSIIGRHDQTANQRGQKIDERKERDCDRGKMIRPEL